MRFVYSYKKSKLKSSVALIYPNKAEVASANLGFQTVFHLLNQNPHLSVRIFTLDSPPKLSELKTFDVVLFSVSYEMDFPNVVKILRMGGISPLRSERNELDPVVVLGGAVAGFSLKALGKVVDGVVVGDGEVSVEIMSNIFAESSSKDEILEKLKGEKFFFTPDYDEFPIPYTAFPKAESLIPAHTVVFFSRSSFNAGLIEIARGCKANCSFCLVRKLYNPYREVSRSEILKVATLYKNFTDRIGLISANPLDHSEIDRIFDELYALGFGFTVSSMRADKLSYTLLKKLVEKGGQRTITLAPETASAGLKKLIRKNIPDEVFFDVVEKSSRLGVKRIRFYFLIGLPSETMEDVEMLGSFALKVRNLAVKNSRDWTPEIVIDVNPLVPKPYTDFFLFEMESVKVLQKKISLLRKILNRKGIVLTGEKPSSAYKQWKMWKGEIDLI